MKIVFESHGYRYSVEHKSDDFDANELKEIFSKILVLSGFGPGAIDCEEGGGYQYVGDDEIVVKKEEIENAIDKR